MAVPLRDMPRSGALRRVVALIVTFLLTTGILIAVPSAAFAADTVINFDNLPSGTTVSNQYGAQGVSFDQAPFGPADFMPKVVSDPGAHSPPNVLDIEQGGFCGAEVNRVGLWARFAAPHNHVSVYVGDLQSLASEHVTLSGYDLNGTAIPAATDTVTTSGGSGVHTLMSITDPASQISFFQVQGPTDAVCFAVDDLSFDAVPSGIGPDFGLSALASSATVTAGGSAVVPLVLHRTATATGPISLTVSGLPSGVSASLNPDPDNGGDGTQITLTLTAAANAPPAVNVPVTVTGKLSLSGGTLKRSVTIPVSVSGTFDLRAQGIDVTQGIQRAAGILVPSGGGSGGQYRGVDLVSGKTTVVRVYADAHGAPQGIPGVGAVLHGFRNGVELPGSPLYPDYGPGTGSTGAVPLPDTGEADPAPVFQAELESNQNAFTFTLPYSWTSGTITLVADVVPPLPSFTGPQVIECQSPSCLADNSFTLNGVTFHPSGSFTLNTIALPVNGTDPVPAGQAFTDAKAVAPLAGTGPGSHFTVFPYVATIDVTSLLPSGGCAVQGAVAQWDADNNGPSFDGTIGVTPTGTNGCTSGRDSEVDFTPNSSVVDDRPLTSVAHELFHQFGLPHASNECGGGQDNDSDDIGQTGEPWLPVAPAPNEPNENPPDDGIGQLEGIGLDTTSEPYTILADGLNGISQYYDFMSYCPANVAFNGHSLIGFGDPGTWVSPQNWEAVFDHFSGQFGGAATQAASAAGSQPGPLTWVAALDPAHLRVIGFVSSSGQVQLTSVGPQVGPPSPRGAASGLTLVARGANGKILASAPMTATHGHVDQVGAFEEIMGTVPASGAESIAVEAHGKVLASRVRPAQAPRVQILAPASGARVGTGPAVLLQWSAASPEHLPLTASVDYSYDGGRSWRTIFIGADRGRVSLPSFYFLGSPDARVRVRVSDGFNEAAAVSAPFTAAGAPPQVSIVSPGPRTQLSGDATLQLAGEAFDQQLRSLAGHSLQWFDGPVPLGYGTTISAGPLPPGANQIHLVARDAAGRTASATIVVNVTPVKIPFLNLTLPARVSSQTSQLTFLASSAVPATLTIGTRSFKLTRAPERLIVPITPGQSPLLLELTATANGTSTPFAAEIPRTGAG